LDIPFDVITYFKMKIWIKTYRIKIRCRNINLQI
jgi:hypothetical protein